MRRQTYQMLDSALYPPASWTSSEYTESNWVLEIPLPDGPEIWDDYQAGTLTFAYPTLPGLLEKAVKVLTRLGTDMTLYINDDSWAINLVRIDFGHSPPKMRCNITALRSFMLLDAPNN